MLPKYHILFGFVFSLILFLIFPEVNLIGAGIIFLSSFLIDVDHYIYYVFKKKNLSLRKAVIYFKEKRKKLMQIEPLKRKEFYSGFCFLHGIEIIIILLLLAYFVSEYFIFVALGITLHLCLDWLEETSKRLRLDKISLIYDWFKYKRLKFLE